MSVHSDNHTTYSDPSTDLADFYETDFYSEDGEISEVKQTKRERAAVIDSGKHVVQHKRKLFKEEWDAELQSNRLVPYLKQYRIILYSTNATPGRLIRNAVNGLRYKYRVGYADEDLFFSVILASGEVGQTSAILFYDTPEQYESHFHVSLPIDIKAKWLRKHNAAKLEMENYIETNVYSKGYKWSWTNAPKAKETVIH